MTGHVAFRRRFGTKCAGCGQGISPSDLVRKARGKVFHLNCFTCMVCNKQLSTGEELYVIDENKFVCKDDYLSSSSLKEGSLNSGRSPPPLPSRGPETLQRGQPGPLYFAPPHPPQPPPPRVRSVPGSALSAPTRHFWGKWKGRGRGTASGVCPHRIRTPGSFPALLPRRDLFQAALLPQFGTTRLPPTFRIFSAPGNFRPLWEDGQWGLEEGERGEGVCGLLPVPSPRRPGSPRGRACPSPGP